MSNRLELLACSLAQQLDSDGFPPLHPRTILLPNPQMKQWLMLFLARMGAVVAGCRLLSVEAVFQKPSGVATFLSIFSQLKNSKRPELTAYLQEKTKRQIELSDHLSSLFFSYHKFGLDQDDWQRELFEELFKAPPFAELVGPIHCFGVDFLPPLYWESLEKAPPLSVYLFSPCIHFWEDVCTHWEKKRLVKKGGTENIRRELETYLSEAPPLLANWGKLGRETLKILDRFDVEFEECYGEEEGESTLKILRRDLLQFEIPREKRKGDGSIHIFQTGSSPWREIEILKENIERLAQEGIPFSEMAVLAPQIDRYLPLIEFVFGDAIPYRILDVEIASQSHFLQGLKRILGLVDSSFETKALLTLFETPSFYRKFNWDRKKLLLIRTWFEQGIEETLDGLIYLTPHNTPWSDADLLEEVVQIWTSLQRDLNTEEKTSPEWAEFLERIANKYLLVDPSDEGKASFLSLLKELIAPQIQDTFPLSVIQHLLNRSSCNGAIHPSHLHTIRFASLEMGTVLPVRALFLIGMDEEHFPRKAFPSSLDLLRNKKGFIPRPPDQDRYLMLQSLFAAEEYLYFSYGHLSADEGKPIAPSLALQELLGYLELHFEPAEWVTAPLLLRKEPLTRRSPDFFAIDTPFPPLPEGEVTVNLSDLAKLARHPWEFYLQKNLGIFPEKETIDSFSWQRSLLVREALKEPLEQVMEIHKKKLPPGLMGVAQQKEITQIAKQWEELLFEWGLEVATWSLLESCREKKRLAPRLFEVPALEIEVSGSLRVKIVGELKTMSERGWVCLSDEILKIWPEALTGALVSQSSELFLLKKGKIVTLPDPHEALRSFLIYYFRALSHPAPLPMNKSYFEDPIADWVLSRASLPPENKLQEKWGWLKQTLAYAEI